MSATRTHDTEGAHLGALLDELDKLNRTVGLAIDQQTAAHTALVTLNIVTGDANVHARTAMQAIRAVLDDLLTMQGTIVSAVAVIGGHARATGGENV